jgi:ketosteroid isomerase-like protein
MHPVSIAMLAFTLRKKDVRMRFGEGNFILQKLQILDIFDEKGIAMETLQQPKVDTAGEVATKFLDAWNGHDIEALMALFKPNGAFATPAFPTPLSGNFMKSYIETLLMSMPDMRATMTCQGALRLDLFAGRYLITGTWTKPATAGPLAEIRPTGNSVQLDSAEFLEVMDGKIAYCVQYYDRMALLTQLGLIPQR